MYHDVYPPPPPDNRFSVSRLLALGVVAAALAALTVGCDDTVSPTVTDPKKPSFGNSAVPDQRYVAGVPVPPLTLPQASGGDGTLSYRLAPDVPGLTFSAETRTLSGLPSAVGDYAMRYEVTDADGDTAALSFRIESQALTTIYWGGYKVIGRTDLNGRNRTLILGGDTLPTVVEVTADKMYWVEQEVNGTGAKIRRANRDGSNPEDIVVDLGSVFSLAIDPAGGRMFWMEGSGQTVKIRRAGVDGSDVEDLVVGDLRGWIPVSVAVDAAGGRMYWSEIDINIDPARGRIRRATLDADNAESILETDAGTIVWAIALDATGGTMYWTDMGWPIYEAPSTGRIRRATLDGDRIADIEDLVTGRNLLVAPQSSGLSISNRWV